MTDVDRDADVTIGNSLVKSSPPRMLEKSMILFFRVVLATLKPVVRGAVSVGMI